MPSTSPGSNAPITPTPFEQILPGKPVAGYQSLTTFTHRYKRYIAYISGELLLILSSPTVLVQAITFDKQLVSVASEPQNGKLVVATKQDVSVLESVTEGWTKIWWEKALYLKREGPEDEARWLSWGNDGELLVGGTRQLSLYSTVPISRGGSPAVRPSDSSEELEERKSLWSKPVPSPVRWAAFSPSANLIATCGERDRLVKIWRRLSFEEGLFDHMYVPHPGAVTHMQWRPLEEVFEERRGSGISGRHDEEPEILHTIANDGVLRVWRTGGIHDLEILVLHTTVDLVSAIPQSPSLTTKPSAPAPMAKSTRYAFSVPSSQFAAAVKAAMGRHPLDAKLPYALEHLKEVSSKEPDLIITLDGHGRMSSWGLQSIGHKRRPETPTGVSKQAFHIAHCEDLPIKFAWGEPAAFEVWFEDATLNVLSHGFNGEIAWWRGDVEAFFSPAAGGKERLRRAACWTGGEIDAGTQHHATEEHIARVGDQRLRDCVLPVLAIADAERPKRKGIVGVTKEGVLLLYHVGAASKTETASQVVAPYESGVKQPSTWTASNELAALASEDAHRLTIVDLQDGYLEHEQTFSSPIERLCHAEKANVLAVGFRTHVDVLAQGTLSHEQPSWHHIKQVSIAGVGLRVKGLAWRGRGALAVAAGNGSFIIGAKVQAEELEQDVKEALGFDDEATQQLQVQELPGCLKACLPVWHPQLLSHLVHQGRWKLATSLVKRLSEKLKFWSEGDFLDPQLQVPPEQLYAAQSLQNDAMLTSDVTTEIHEQLEEKRLPQLSSKDQASLRRLLDAMLFCAEHVRGLDNFALRFLFAWKLAVLESEGKPPKTNGPTPNDVSTNTPAPRMHWREIAFAHQSTSQQPLLDILASAYEDRISWRTARNLGLFAWLSDREALTRIFESLAQSAYRASSPPDPIDASLYFLALHKKSTLLGLWRIATWHKEQRTTMNFLRRDFTVEANRTAAKKNAYALMGKRRFEYAAAFFLLAEDAPSATSVLAGQCGDVMLAIAVARLHAGDGSPVLRNLVETRLLPDATKAGNRWQMSWCHSVLFEKVAAAEALVRPLKGVKKWEMDDPHTLTLYKHLRKAESEHEWEAVLRGTRLLRRMGLSFPALELVRTWEFKDPREAAQTQAKAQTNGVADPTELTAPASMLDDFASPVSSTQAPSLLEEFSSAPAKQSQEPPSMLDGFASAAAQGDEKTSREAKAAELLKQLKAKKEGKTDGLNEKAADAKKEPTQFKEPDANSLLDSFGF